MKNIYLLFALLLIGQVGFSQKKISKEKADKIVYNIAYEVAKQSIKDYEAGKFLTPFEKSTEDKCDLENCCTSTCHYAVLGFLSEKKLTPTEKLCARIAQYTDSIPEGANGKEQYGTIQSLLTKEEAVLGFSANHPDFNKVIATIQKDLKKQFKIEEEQPRRRGGEASSGGGGGILSTLGWLSTILLVVGAFFYFGFLKPRGDQRIRQLKNEIKKVREEKNSLEENLKAKNQEIAGLRNSNDRLEQSESALKSRIDQIEKSQRQNSDRPKQKIVIKEFPKNEEGMTVYDTFYMPVPDSDGSFNQDYKMDDYDWTESVYKFEITNKEHTKAVFSIVNDSRMIKRAMSGFDIYIKPVCNAVNAFNMNATRISTETKGSVSLNGNTWHLDKKAEIRYEA